MGLEFKKVSDFKRGIFSKLLSDAYSFDGRWKHRCDSDWKEVDDFFFDNLQIADKCGFITTLNNEAIGLAIWDPRNISEYVEIGHNCIKSKYKGNGYGRIQLQEAVKRIAQNDVKKIKNNQLISAQRMYESIGFKFCQRRKNESITDFSGEYIDYAIENIKEVVI